MRRDKSELIDPGLDVEGTTRGVLTRDVVTDDPLQWPRYAPMLVLEEGRDFRLVGATSTTLTIRGVLSLLDSGDHRFAFAAGDVIQVVNAGAANGTYTVAGTTFNGGVPGTTTITVAETVGTATLVAFSRSALTTFSRVTTPTIRWPTWLSYAIQSQTTGATPNVTVMHPIGFLPTDSPVCECDMFLMHDLVEITGSYQGLNDGIRIVRANYTQTGSTSGDTRTIYLDGYLNVIPGGQPLGTIRLVMPPPLRLKPGTLLTDYRRAVMRWYRALAKDGAAIQARRIDERGDWSDMSAADIAVNYADDPIEP